MSTIPVHIISGFLGAGKTTLMNRCLGALPDGQKAAIIVNDFGKVCIDAELIDRGDYALRELSSGCVCCTLAGPLTDSLTVLAEEEQPDVIVLETTGIAEPAQIALLFGSGTLSDHVHVGNVICVLDSSAFTKYEAHFEIMRKQVEQANTILINKTDLATPEVLAAVRARVAFLAQPGATVVETQNCETDPATLYTERPVYFPKHPVSADHGHTFHSCTLDYDGIYDLDALSEFFDKLDASIVRAKGIVRTESGPAIIQKSLSGVDVIKREDEPALSRIVFVGRGLDERSLEAGLDACRTVS